MGSHKSQEEQAPLEDEKNCWLPRFRKRQQQVSLHSFQSVFPLQRKQNTINISVNYLDTISAKVLNDLIFF